ncbi:MULTISPECIES: hypothetical protein [Enterobacter cloacae complex]|uniref:Uncharacterized protein n=1 Tax=Enterobacter cloacae TaxID=550 RepID=A0A7H8UG22_ENTCL|nr:MULTISPECIES: hypothetical protein [Enterobacter cloacae complex]MDE4079924.1 hypothetical protein [Enterobacter pasteurii]QKZ98798.1 hypothetical protein HWQ14_14500 [Enterobacter cloacae]
MSLTVREQNRFIAALDNLRTSERVHKSDLKTVNKTLDKMGSVANSKELLASLSDRMRQNFDIKDSKKVESFIENVKDKLEKQESKIHDKKLTQLNNIGNRIFQASQKIEVDHLSKEIALKTSAANRQLECARSDKNLVHEMIDKRNEAKEFVSIEKHKLEQITPQKISEDQEKRINRLTQKTNSEIDKLKVDIRRINKREPELFKFLNNLGKTDVINDLAKAQNNKFLKRTMATPEYAEKMFGTKTIVVEGRRSYSATTTKEVLSDNGAAFLTRIKKYQNAKNEVAAIKHEISRMESARDARIAAIKSEERSPLQSKYDSRIAQYQDGVKEMCETENRALNTLAKRINFIDSTIEHTTALKKGIEEKAGLMADPEVKQSAARHEDSINRLVVRKEKLENSYQRLVEASNTGKNYVSDVESDIGSDFESHV